MKPGNVLVLADGSVKLLDLGLARMLDRDLLEAAQRSTRSASAVVAGTLGYIAPEQLAGRPADGRADVV